MNTSGLNRGYMAKNMDIEDFLDRVVEALNREFEGELDKIKIKLADGNFIISGGKYMLTIDKTSAEKLKTPYGLDSYILEEFRKQGFRFEEDRSQYIEYCYGNYKD